VPEAQSHSYGLVLEVLSASAFDIASRRCSWIIDLWREPYKGREVTRVENLNRLPILRYYQGRSAVRPAFRFPSFPGAPQKHDTARSCQNAFCHLVASTPAGCQACWETHVRAQHIVAGSLVSQKIHCFAGLTVVAVPVVVGGVHTATLLSGQVFREQPTADHFLRVVRRLNGGASSDWAEQARKAYFETPVVSAERFERSSTC
jgi:ligand-binding sensor protein